MANNFLASPIEDALSKAPSFGLPDSFRQSEGRRQSVNITPGNVPYKEYFSASSQKYGVPINVLMALAQQESDFNPTALGQPTQYGRAKGIMQYIDSTARGLGINPYDPMQAIDGAARQLRERLDNGYSMQEAIQAHFGGDDRKQWGPKTRAYGSEVLGRAQRFFDGTGGSVKQPVQGQQLSQEQQLQADYPAAQSAMENMDQNRLRDRAARLSQTLDELNKEEPGRYRPATAEEIAQAQAKLAPQEKQNQQPQKPVEGEQIDFTKVNEHQSKVGKIPVQTELRAWEPTLWEKFLGMFPGNRDAAAVELAARNIAEREGVSVDEVYRSAGGQRPLFNPEGRAPVQAVVEGAKVVGEQLPNVPKATANAVLRAVRGGDVPASDQSMIDRGITATDIPPSKDADPNYSSLEGIDQSLGFTVSNLVPSIAATALGNVASPGVGTAAGFTTSAGIAYRASKDQFLSDVRKMATDKKGSQLTDKEWSDIRTASEAAAVKYGAWEAIPEAMGSMLAIKMISHPLAGATRAARLADATARIGKEQAMEQATETMTGWGQNKQEQAVGLTNEDLSIGDAWRKQALQTAVVTGISGGVMQGGRAIYDKVTGRKAGTPPADEAAPPVAEEQPVPAEATPEVTPEQAQQDNATAAAPTPSRDDTGLSPDAGPLERALRGTADQPDEQNGNFWAGEPGSAINVQAKGDPETAMNVTIERYQRDGNVTVRDENGTPYELSQDAVDINAAVAPISEEQTLQTAGTPEKSQNNRQEEQQKAQSEALNSAMKDAENAQRQADRPLTDFSEDELRDRMRYLARQAKTNGGWTKNLTNARREVEKVLDAKLQKPEESASVTGDAGQLSGTEVAAPQQPDNSGTVHGSAEGAAQAGETGVRSVAGTGPGVDADPSAAVSDGQPGNPLMGTDGKPKWFASADKASGHIQKKGLTGYRVVQVRNNRFEIHKDGPLTDEGTMQPVADNPQVDLPATSQTRAESGAKVVNPRSNRVKKLVGSVGDLVSPTGSVGSVSAGSQYRISRIEKNGTVHLVNQDTAASTTVSLAELESGHSRKVNWDRQSPQEQSDTKSQTASAKPAQPGAWEAFPEDSGTLGIPRAEMPQVKAEHRGPMVNFLNARGVEHREEQVQASELKPTQAEFSPEKVARATENTGSDRSILVSNDGYVVDGHHQWLAAKQKGEQVKAIVLDAPIKKLLPMVHEFPSSLVDTSSAGNAANSATNAPKTAPKTAKSAQETEITEPPKQDGMTRVYHSGSVGEGETGRWVSTNRTYASDYRGDLPLHYLDISKDDPRVNNPDYPDQGVDNGFTFNFELTPEESAKLQAISRDGDRFAGNKLFTADKVAAARARMKSKFGQLNSGLDPELLIDGMTIAGAYIESGVRKFSDYAKAMAEDFGDGVKPYLLSFWEGARNYPGLDTEGMTSVADSAKEHAALLEPQHTATPAVGEVKERPARRTRKTGQRGDITLTQDWGVDHIDGYSENSTGSETGSDVKTAWLKEGRSYLSAVADQLENAGFKPTTNGKGKTTSAVNVNAAGDAVSGDISLKMDGPNGTGIYIHMSDTSLRGVVPTTTSGIAIMYRTTTTEDRSGTRSQNRWAPVDLSATDLARMAVDAVNNEVNRASRAGNRPTGNLDEMVTQFDQEVENNGNATELGERRQATLGRVPANEVSRTEEGGDAGNGAPERSVADSRRDGPAGEQRVPGTRSVGNDTREVPVSSRGTEPEGQAGSRAETERSSTERGNGDAAVRGGRGSRPAAGVTAQDKPAGLFTIDPETLGKGGKKTKYRNNIAAIRLLKALESENRQATADEQAILAKYVGWGGIPEAFARNDGTSTSGWEKEVAELKGILLPAELDAAIASTRNAHYTSAEIVSAMWQALDRLGFTGGRVLEPSVGVGNFFGLMPHGIRKASALHGVELDTITSGIATQLYPEAKIARMGYQDYTIPDGYFDVAIGNPPFGSEKLYDRNRKDLSGFSIHNYFFARSVDALRPGGVMAMVVTNRFMDGAKDEARQYIGERADLLGAIRLPNNAFAKNAGTEVTTDIIFLRKPLEGEALSNANRSWLDTTDYTDKNGNVVPLNRYFATHPENMLGEFGAFGTMYRKGDTALVARDGQNTQQLLAEAIDRLPVGEMTPAVTVAPETRETVQAENTRVGSMFINADGRVMTRGDDVMGERTAEPASFRSVKAEERVKGMIRVRNALQRLRELQLSDRASDAAIEEARTRLNSTYDGFVKANGPINSQANKLLFRDDPTWPQISALEDSYDKGISADIAKKTGQTRRNPSAVKAAIFSKRTQQPHRAPDSAASAKDALVASLAERGRADMEYMQNLYGKNAATIADELGDLLFNDPQSGWQTRDAYLSGNVKQKLAQAEAAAKTNPEFFRNVDALKAVQPKDVEAVDIAVKPGASWIPADVMGSFADHLAESTGSKAFFNPLTAGWIFPKLEATSSASARFGTGRLSLGDILTAASAQRAVQVYDTHQDGSRTLNETETQLANEKVSLVRQEWDRWIWQDDGRRTQLARLYNDQFNTDVSRDFDGSHLSFPGKVSDDIIRLRPHQANAVWRIVQGGSTLLDHVVGAGKTFSIIAAIMELRRMGLARKPILAVPNHLVGQWAKDFIKLYPGANILAASKRDFEAANRKRFFARIATGDWDAVIVAHSSFGKVGVHPDTESAFIREEIADITASITAIEQADGKKSRNVKQAEERRKKQEEKLKKLLDTENKDDSLYWDDLGIDALFVDEAHEFKNLAYTTGMRNVAGLGTSKGSNKAADLYMKTRLVRDATGGRNVVFATGTPISNTMAEMFTMQRYLDRDTLNAAGLSHFDAWARMFGEVVTDWELSPSGQYKMNSRFAKFVNMPELMQRYTSFADVINRDDINAQLAAQGTRLPVPKVKGGKPTNVVVPRSEDQAAFIGEPIKDENGNATDEYPNGTLVFRAEHLPKKAEKGKDNMLKIMSDARKAALDMRLLFPELPDNPNSKVNVAADEIAAVYEQWNADKGAQLVFIDLSTPKASRGREADRIRQLVADAESADIEVASAAQEQLDRLSPDELLALESNFSVYDDLKQKLIDRGIPEKEIAFIHDANTDEQKTEMFAKVNAGSIRVLLGSTAKMGAGMNAQERLVALHHLDAPWRPSDLEQREGRIIRQGNKLYERDPDGFEVIINRYATKQTLDSRMWQTIEAKARFIEQVRKGNTAQREIEDIGGEAANAAEMKAASSGNPLMLEEMTLRQRVRTLENERLAHDRDQFRIRDKVREENLQIKYTQRTLAQLRKDVTLQQPSPFSITLDGQTFSKRKEAGEALLSMASEMERSGASERENIGSYGDFRLSLNQYRMGEFSLDLEGTGTYSVKFDRLKADAQGLTVRLANAVNDFAGAISKMETALARAEKALPALESQLRAWPKTEELKAAEQRHREVIDQLRPKKDQKVDAPSTQTPDEPQYGDLPEGGAGFAADAATDLAAYDEMFRYPRATGQRTLQGVFDTVMPNVKIRWQTPKLDDNSSETDVTHIRGVTGEGRDINIYETPEEVWFDVSNMKEGEQGAGIYQAVADYALNTGRVFVGDPDGLSDIALRRRTEAMLSSALKHGTTDHLAPHARQKTGDKALGVPALRWKDGDFAFNIQSLIDTSLASIKAAIPEIDRARYDFETGAFRSGEGKPLSDGLLQTWLAHPRVREARAGRASLKRAILLNTLARTESGARPGLLERIYGFGTVRGFQPALNSTFYDWTSDNSYTRLPEGNRIQLQARLRKLQQLHAQGQISPEEYSSRISEIADWLENRSQESAFKKAFTERQRGNDLVLERLHRARRRGEISQKAADIAIWALNRNPQLADDLGISISSRGGSRYDRVERVIHLMTTGMRDNTPIHEVLHHTERMMPPGVQKGIVEAYNRSWKQAYKKASPELRAALDNLRLSVFGDKQAQAAARKAFEDGVLDYDQHYQLTNASEYWAVNAARIMAGRHEASGRGWVARAREWIRAFIQKARDILQLPSDAAVLRGLDAVTNGDGSYQSTSMLGIHPAADKPVVATEGDYQNMPASPNPQDPNPNLPTPEEDKAFVRRQWDKFRSDMKHAPSDKMTDAMSKLLYNTPYRPLAEELGRNVPALQEYLKLKQKMDAMRSDWHAKTDNVAQRWLKYRAHDKVSEAENKRLMEIMHESTIQQVDPSERYDSMLTPRDHDALRTALAGTERGDEVLAKAAEDRRRRQEWERLKPEFDKLSPEARAIYQEVRNAYTRLADAYEAVLLSNMEKAIAVRIRKAEREHRREMRRITDEGLTGQERIDAVNLANRRLKASKTKIAWNRKARITQLRQQFETERLRGPYFPLARFGKLFVTVRDKAGKVISFSRFEKASEQREFAELMKEDPNQSVQIGTLNESASLRKGVDAGFVADVEDILAELPNAEKIKDEVWQRYLETLPDFSIRKNRIHRTGREGYNADALRAFGNSMFHGSHQLARMAYTFDLEEALDAAREQAENTSDPVRDGMVVNEMEQRHQFIMNPTGGALATAVTQASFVYFLALNPKAAIANMFQTVVMGVPMLAANEGKWSSMTRAFNQLNRALADTVRGKGVTEKSRRLTTDERSALEEAKNIGLIDRTQSHDLAGIGETGIEYSAGREKVMKVLGYLFHHTERINREVTFLAAYRMAKARGLSRPEAIDDANRMTWKIHFDYQNTSRPRIMHSDAMKMLLVFKNYAFNMLYRLFRDFHQSFKGATPELRKEARIQLAGVTGMMMLTAGVSGTWGYGILMMLAAMFIGGDKDPEDELRKNMQEALGPMMTGIIMDGLPGYATGVSLSSSVGMADLWWRDPNEQLEGGKDVVQYMLMQMLGAPAGIAMNMGKGVQQITDGHEWRGIETMMPNFIKNPMKAMRFENEGAKNLRGDMLVEEVSHLDAFKQLLGATPAKIAEQYAINNAGYRKQDFVIRQRKTLMDDYWRASQADDDNAITAVEDRIDVFNEKYGEDMPGVIITPKTLNRSAKTREKNADDATGGARYNRATRDYILDSQRKPIYQ